MRIKTDYLNAKILSHRANLQRYAMLLATQLTELERKSSTNGSRRSTRKLSGWSCYGKRKAAKPTDGISTRHKAIAVVLNLMNPLVPDGGRSAGDGRHGSINAGASARSGLRCPKNINPFGSCAAGTFEDQVHHDGYHAAARWPEL